MDHLDIKKTKENAMLSQKDLLQAVSARMRVRDLAAVRREKLRESMPEAGFPVKNGILDAGVPSQNYNRPFDYV